MINVHETQVPAWLARGYVTVAHHTYEACGDKPEFRRVWLADPKVTCLHQMRPWTVGSDHHHGLCTLDYGHRGRHTTVSFYCDGCHKTRRGQPAQRHEDAVFCWMCVNRKVR